MGLNAVVTLVTTDSYVPGALVAVHSLLEAEGATPANPFETVCLVTPATVSVQSIKALRRNFSLVVGVEELRSGSRAELELLGTLTQRLQDLQAYYMLRESRADAGFPPRLAMLQQLQAVKISPRLSPSCTSSVWSSSAKSSFSTPTRSASSRYRTSSTSRRTSAPRQTLVGQTASIRACLSLRHPPTRSTGSSR